MPQKLDDPKPIPVDIVDDDDDNEVIEVTTKMEQGLTISPVKDDKANKKSSLVESGRRKIKEAVSTLLNAAAASNTNDIRRTRKNRAASFASQSGTAAASSVSSVKSSVSSSPVGEKELEHLINEAEYEIHQDPYRGISSHQQSIETQTKITTPWHACEWGSLQPEPIEDVEDLDDPQIVVRHVGNCACPTLKEWTKSIIVERNKKKTSSKKRRRNSSAATSLAETIPPIFQVGSRPPGEPFVCPCDFNPLCFATLGGVVNDVIEERCRELDPFVPSADDDGKTDTTSPASAPSEPQGPDTSSPKISNYFRKRSKKGNVKNSSNKEDEDDIIEVVEGPPLKRSIQEDKSKTQIVDMEMVEVKSKAKRSSCNGGDRFDGDESHDDSSSDPFVYTDESPAASPTRSRSPSRRKTPLLQPSSDFPKGDPMDIFREQNLPEHDMTCIEFSSHTKEALKQCRSSVQVDTASIRSFVHRTLRIPLSEDDEGDQSNSNHITVDKYMKILKLWHQQLLFDNPITKGKDGSGDKILLSMPPGIRNLGATCYLNTQLQCLAQNLTFLNGIFSWHVVDETHMMNSVMTKLQFLLAQMFLGGESKLTTLEFSNALGLEHYEQQDPNEFARLLFDRMDESFQQCDNGGDLSNLLNRIFHGVSTYETICLTCGNKSERNEGFMDLNLPIVKPPKEDKKKTGTIFEAFASAATKNVDTDLQYCLDQYTCAEMLDGENQYFCSECNEKRDAKRVLKLTELPPVLNVQLSRYIFDRTKFTKKKVCDKVLLPKSLTVMTAGASKKKFLLCAVMRHQGTSAYSGHYLAEAMDWITGTWFEFNDDIVKLLPGGPSSSFDPDDDQSVFLTSSDSSNDQKLSSLSGSQDAYNMYYVEEEYLSKAAQRAIDKRSELCIKGPNAGEVLDDVTDQRKERFKALSGMCLDDAQIFDRLARRRLGIRNYFLPNARSLVNSNSIHDRLIWVPGRFLRTYLECGPEAEFDCLLESSDPIIQNNDLRCVHGNGLHPRVARTGKLLPLHMYDALVGLLRGERALLRGELYSNSLEEVDIEDHMIGSDLNMICEECSTLHRDELSNKLRNIRLAKALFDALDPKISDLKLHYGEDEAPKADEDRFAFVISKAAVTKFRKQITLMLKSLSNIGAGGESASKISSGASTLSEGLGALEIISWDSEGGKMSSAFRNFNDTITCSHGNLLAVHGRVIKYVPSDVWQMIKKLFPGSTEHKHARVPKDSSGNSSIRCRSCASEQNSIDELRNSIHSWARETKAEPILKDLLDTKRTLSHGHEAVNFQIASNGCRLIHNLDIVTWREAVKELSSTKKIKGETVDAIRANVVSRVFPNRHATVLEFENTPMDKFGASLRSFICHEHHGVVCDAILEPSEDISKVEDSRRNLAAYVTVVSDKEYEGYTDSLACLLCLLSSSSIFGTDAFNKEATGMRKSVQGIGRSHHPAIQSAKEGQGQERDSLKLTFDGSVKQFTVSPHICTLEACSKEYTPQLVMNKDKEEQLENVSVGSDDQQRSTKKKSSANRGSGAFDPIIVESDLEDDNASSGKYNLRVFHVKQGASEEEMVKSLQDVSAVASDTNASNDLRRSSRKRKHAYPSGVLLSEATVEVGIHYNIAAICLMMFQNGIHIDFSSILVVSHQAYQEPKAIRTTIFGDDLEKTLRTILDDKKEEVDITSDVVLLYERENDKVDPNATDFNESLFQYSNIDETVSSNTKGGDTNSKTRPKKKSRPSERGFQGTLLHGPRPVAPAAADDSCKKDNADDDEDIMEGHPVNPDDENNDDNGNDDSVIEPAVVVDDDPSIESVESARPTSPVAPRRIALSDDTSSLEDDAILRQGPTFKTGNTPDKGKPMKEIGSTETTDAEDGATFEKIMTGLKDLFGSTSKERQTLAATMAISSCITEAAPDHEELLQRAVQCYLQDESK